MSRLIVIGLDGMSLPLFQPMLGAGDLPVLARLISGGRWHSLKTMPPPYTASSWTTITTGYDLDQHGLFDFFIADAEKPEPRLVTDADVCVPRIWDYLTAGDKTSLIVNVPVTHPARPLKGALIPGYLAPEQPECYPQDLFEQMAASIGAYRVYSPWESMPRATFEQQIEGFVELTRMRVAAAMYLCQRFPDWDFLMVEFQKTDGVYHLLNRIPSTRAQDELVRGFFRSVDTAMGDILALAPGANVLVVSDHGNGLTPWTFALNSWLRAQGLLVSKIDAHSPALEVDERIKKNVHAAQSDKHVGRWRWIERMLSTFGIGGTQLERVVTRLGLTKVVRRLVPHQMLMATVSSETIDWYRSKAFCYYPSGMGIRLNVCGREATGCVTPGSEYEGLVAQLIGELGALRDPEGKPVVEWVRHRRDVYGPDVGTHVPDILLSPRNMDYRIEKRLRGQLFIRNRAYYSHKTDGLIIAHGPDLSGHGESDAPPTTLDITPTVLHLAGMPVSKQMPGKVLRSWLSNDAVQREIVRLDYPELRPQGVNVKSPFSREEESLVKERLRGIGYLD